MINQVIGFFDLYNQYRPTGALAHAAAPDDIAGWRQFLVWFCAALGVVLGPYALDAAGGTSAEFSVIFGSWVRLLWAAVFGAVLIALAFLCEHSTG